MEPEAANDNAQILDACCGGRHWWWDKAHPLALYMDERQVPLGNEWRATWECSPDVVGDFRAMPFADESFQLVLFDPPHIVRRNLATKWSTRFYGALNPDTWQDDLRRGFAECWRVVAAGGSLVFKWSGDPARCSPYFPAAPIVGTRWKKDEDEAASWFIFYKPLTTRSSAHHELGGWRYGDNGKVAARDSEWFCGHSGTRINIKTGSLVPGGCDCDGTVHPVSAWPPAQNGSMP